MAFVDGVPLGEELQQYSSAAELAEEIRHVTHGIIAEEEIMPRLRGLEYGMEDLKGRVEHLSDQVDLLDIRTETRFGRLEEQVQALLQKSAADDDERR